MLLACLLKKLDFFIVSYCCLKLDASGRRSETLGKFRNVVLEKDGEEQLDRSCEK
jgi:hypothetical protein